jgi:hypothetical protein
METVMGTPTVRSGIPPFTTRAAVTTAKRRLALNTFTVLASSLLAVYCSRTFDDTRLVVVYLIAAGIHLLSAVNMALRISVTGDLPGPDDGAPARA